MLSKSDQPLKRFEIYLLIFISIQPVIDVLTTASMTLLSLSATFGVFFRLLVMCICFVYIVQTQIKKEKKYLLYLFGLMFVLAVSLIINYLFKDNFHLTEEVKFLAKIFYAHIMLFTYIILFASINKHLDLLSILKKYLLYAILTINLVMIISIFTSTSLKSYDYTKIGFTGWFFAGNELGAILAIIFPFSIIYALSKTNRFSLAYYWLPVIFTAFSLLMLGTKVGYGALILSLIVTAFMCFITWYLRKSKPDRKPYLVNGIISSSLIIILIVITPFTPIFKNTFAHFQLLGINFDTPDTDSKSNGNEKQNPPKKGIQNIEKGQVENLLLSSREIFLKNQKQQFKEAPVIQKIFGMGYAGNYSKQPKLIEMDFHDLFFSLGIVGFLVFILPIAFIIFRVGYIFIKNFSVYFSPINVLFLVSLVLGLGISFTAGHVLTAPAVSIYLSIILAYLLIHYSNKKTHNNK
jgi:hypothetical protein